MHYITFNNHILLTAVERLGKTRCGLLVIPMMNGTSKKKKEWFTSSGAVERWIVEGNEFGDKDLAGRILVTSHPLLTSTLAKSSPRHLLHPSSIFLLSSLQGNG